MGWEGDLTERKKRRDEKQEIIVNRFVELLVCLLESTRQRDDATIFVEDHLSAFVIPSTGHPCRSLLSLVRDSTHKEARSEDERC